MGLIGISYKYHFETGVKFCICVICITPFIPLSIFRFIVIVVKLVKGLELYFDEWQDHTTIRTTAVILPGNSD